MDSVRSRLIRFSRTIGAVAGILLMAAGTAAAQSAADSAWSRGDLEAAERLYRAQFTADSTDDLALMRLALLAGWDRRFDESVSLFDQLLELTPSNIEAHVARGRVLGWKGDLGASLEAYDRALTVDTQNREALRARAQALAWDRRLEDAAQLYDSLVRTDPADSVALFGSALIATWQWKLDSAEVLYDRVLNRAPGYRRARQGKARVTAARGNLVVAEQQWRAILAEDTLDVASLLGMAQVLRWQGRYEAAYAAVAKARELEPLDRDVRDEYEWVWSRIGSRVASGAVFERDSDNNRMFTILAAANWPLLPKVQIEARAYRRSAEIVGTAIPTPVAWGGIVTARKYFDPGWTVQGGVGISSSDAVGADEIANLLLAVGTPVRQPLALVVGYSRYALDATGPQVLRSVRVDDVRIDATWRWSQRWTVSTGLRVGEYVGTESNLRVGWNARAIHHLSPRYSLGLVTDFFTFEKDLVDGYFDPSFFGLAELEGTMNWKFRRRITFRLWGGPGLQQIEGGISPQATFRIQSRLTYRIIPGREIRLDGAFSTAGVQSFATGAADYRYGSVGLSFGWVF